MQRSSIASRRHDRLSFGRCLPLATLLWAGSASAQAPLALELKPCHLEQIAEWARCGDFEVPEDREAPQARRIRLRVAVLPSVEQPARPDPVFLLAGGPGQSAVGVAAAIRSELGVVNRRRDIVLVDQRGTGGSNPLRCGLDFNRDAFDDEAKAESVRSCLTTLDADPTKYGTLNHVEDLESVRQALGYHRINLYGGSYGTRVAQVYMREHPDSLRAVVMDGVAPMDMRIGLEMGGDAQLTLDAVFDRCEADRRCDARFPGIRQRFQTLLDDLEASPRQLVLPGAATGELETVRMDHRLFALGLRGLLYSPETQRLVPLLIDQAANESWTGLLGLTLSLNESLMERMTPGLLLAVLCTEDLVEVDPADISDRERDSFVGTAQIEEFLGYCAAWPKPTQALDRAPVANDRLPVLLLSGALDPATPPYRAVAASQRLGRSRHLVVAAGGHTVARMGCLPELIDEFIESRDSDELDTSCLDDIAYPSFYVNVLGPTP